jgi:hypothetical protein
MTKASEQDLVAAIADDFNTYVGKGVRLEPLLADVEPNLNINDLDRLLRIHFVLTEQGGGRPGVIDFVGALPKRLRQLRTTVSRRIIECRGEVRGRIDWQETVKRRYQEAGVSQTQYACRETRENYDTDENLVLKILLSRIHRAVFDDLELALEAPAEYPWVGVWVDEPQSLAAELNRLYRTNIYLERIDTNGRRVTERMLRSVERSRNPLYQEAAQLLSRYRRLMNHDFDPREAKELLRNVFVRPSEVEILFELYWVFRVLDCYGDVRFEVLEGGSDLVASWETTDGSQYALYHDSTGSASLSFSEGLTTIEQPQEDGYLYRTIQITERWQHLAEEYFGISGHGTLWGGRPDILIERYPPATEQPMEVFVGEVKYTTDRSYSAQGLRELLEYMAFVRSNADYLEDADDVLTSNRVKGALFVDRVEESVPISGEEIPIVGFGEPVAKPL